MILLAEITAAIDAAGTTTTLRYATQAYNHKSAPGPYRERIVETIGIRREIRGAGGGRGAIAFRDLVLGNADGALDALAGHAFDGRRIALRMVDGPRADYATATTLATATMGPASFDLERVSIPIRDRLAELDQPLHAARYDGSNVLPDGLEGTGDDIQGLPKPEPEGLPLNVRPPLVNTSRLIWQFAAGARDADVADVFEGGVALTRGADYTSQSDMETNAPAAGEYRVWPRASDAGGFFRLGSAPTHTITCDIVAGATAADRTIGQVLRALALRAPTISAGDVSDSDVSDLDAALPEPVELWQPSESTILREMERLAEGAGVWFGFDRNGVLRMGAWDAPGTPVATLKETRPARGDSLTAAEFDLVDLESLRTRAGDIPVAEVTARWGRNHTPQADLQTAVTAERRAIVESEWRRAIAEDAAVHDKHVNARAVEIDTPWATRTGADDLAARTLARDKVQRRRLRVSAALKRGLDQTVDLADTLAVQADRFDLSGGKAHRVRAIDADPVAGRIEYEVVG